METRVGEANGRVYVECLPDGGLLTGERDVLDLLGVCGGEETHRLMLHAANLPAEFFRLGSGLAGVFLLKFGNYHMRVAAVLTPGLVNQGRFREMALELNRGNEFRIFYEREAAELWLTAE